MAESDEWLVDESALWSSGNPRWGVVRAVVIDGDYALVFDDQNSDYREVELSIYERAGDLWQLIANQDDAGLPDVGQGTGRGWAADVLVGGGYGWAYGREQPRATVKLSYKGEPVDVTADADGWWMCIRKTPEGDNDSPIRLG